MGIVYSTKIRTFNIFTHSSRVGEHAPKTSNIILNPATNIRTFQACSIALLPIVIKEFPGNHFYFLF
jgi:hypothetical protein